MKKLEIALACFGLGVLSAHFFYRGAVREVFDRAHVAEKALHAAEQDAYETQYMLEAMSKVKATCAADRTLAEDQRDICVSAVLQLQHRAPQREPLRFFFRDQFGADSSIGYEWHVPTATWQPARVWKIEGVPNSSFATAGAYTFVWLDGHGAPAFAVDTYGFPVWYRSGK